MGDVDVMFLVRFVGHQRAGQSANTDWKTMLD